MSKIAGNSYDEGNRENELGFDPYQNGFDEELSEQLFESSVINNSKKFSENETYNSKSGRIYRRALINILNGYKGKDKEVSDFLNNIHSFLIVSRDTRKYDARETACAFLNKKTNCAFGEINRNSLCISDGKLYNLKKLYQEYLQFLKDNKQCFKHGKNFAYKKKDFEILIRQNTLVKDRGQKVGKQLLRSSYALGLPKYRYK